MRSANSPGLKRRRRSKPKPSSRTCFGLSVTLRGIGGQFLSPAARTLIPKQVRDDGAPETEMGAGVSASPHCAELVEMVSLARGPGHRSQRSGVASLPHSARKQDRGGSAALLGTMLPRWSLSLRSASKRAVIIASGACTYRSSYGPKPVWLLVGMTFTLVASDPAGGGFVRDRRSDHVPKLSRVPSRTKRILPPRACGKRGYRV